LVVYWAVRSLLQPLLVLYFRLRRTGTEHIPTAGPLLLAANHRSFSDPFMIGLCLRRPIRFVAKAELFDKAWKARILLALGAFPVRRGDSDEQAIETARVILGQGGAVGIFPEGTRVRSGPVAEPKGGLARIALEAGAPIVPVAIAGTENIRRGWRIRPRKVRIRCGPPQSFPCPINGSVTPDLAREVTARVWSCVELQWEWLGGTPPIRNVAVIGAGSWGTALAVLLARGGAAVQVGCRTADQAAGLCAARSNERYLPGVLLPPGVRPRPMVDLDLEGVDLVCLAMPSRELGGAIEAIRHRLPEQVGVLVLSKGLVAPGGELPSERVVARTGRRPVACLGGPAHAAEAVDGRASLVVASSGRVFGAQLARILAGAGVECEASSDLVGVQLAGCAKNAASLAAGAALGRGLNAAGAAAGNVFAECHALARQRGAVEESFTGLAGAGDLVATVLASRSRNRRAGELLSQGMAREAIEGTVDQAAEALDFVPLLSAAMREAGIEAPATAALASLVGKASAVEAPASRTDADFQMPLSAVA
jgi:1-acyl-sn-glycerol-3-phosphate acyltransferase